MVTYFLKFLFTIFLTLDISKIRLYAQYVFTNCINTIGKNIIYNNLKDNIDRLGL